MRLVYADEAGTSANEQVTVVAGIIVDPDFGELSELDRFLDEVKNRLVPSQYRDGFVFHAAELFQTGKKDRFPEWDMGGRIELALEVMSVPRRLGIPFGYGMARSNIVEIDRRIDPVLFRHIMAFTQMVQSVNQHIEWYGGDGEVAILVCEQIKERHEIIRKVLRHLQDVPLAFNAEHQKPNKLERAFGVGPRNKILSGRRVQGTALFVEKGMIPALEIADAIATGMRRFFIGANLGEEACKAIIGHVLHREDFSGALNGQVIYNQNKLMRNWKGKPIPLCAPIRWLHGVACQTKSQFSTIFFPDTVDRLEKYMSMAAMYWLATLQAGRYPVLVYPARIGLDLNSN